MTADTTPSVALELPPPALPLMVTTAPERIWLNIFTDGDNEEEFPPDHEGVTWCDQDVGDADVPYVRADVAQRAVEAATQELRQALDVAQGVYTNLQECANGLADENAALQAEVEALRKQEPIAHVPVHHKKGPLWMDTYGAAETGGIEERRPKSYPHMPHSAGPVVPAAPVQAVPQWMPIETAPKDPRTRILLRWRSGKFDWICIGAWASVEDAPRLKHAGCPREGWTPDDGTCIPRNQKDCIGWQPLPAAPVGTEGAAA